MKGFYSQINVYYERARQLGAEQSKVKMGFFR